MRRGLSVGGIRLLGGRVVVVDEGEKENGRSCVLLFSFLSSFTFCVDFVWDGWWWLD